MNNEECIDELKEQSKLWYKDICDKLVLTLKNRGEDVQQKYQTEVINFVNSLRSNLGDNPKKQMKLLTKKIKQQLITLYRFQETIKNYPLFDNSEEYQYLPQVEYQFDDSMNGYKNDQQPKSIKNHMDTQDATGSFLDKIKSHLTFPPVSSFQQPTFLQQYFNQDPQDFKVEDQIQTILKKEPSEKMVICKLCSRQFKEYINYRQHLLYQHHYQTFYQCPDCEFNVTLAKQLTAHLLDTHRNQKQFKKKRGVSVMAYKCPFTHELFTNKSRLERHVSNRTTFMKVVQYNANTNQY